MITIRATELPPNALLKRYCVEGSYTDCFVLTAGGIISQASFVEAFYCSRVFKVERTLLTWLALRPANDCDARSLAEGTTETFSAWKVEEQTTAQLLLADLTGRTRSWLMAAPADPEGETDIHPPSRTNLYFGSAVLGARRGPAGKSQLGVSFHALLGFHKAYSRALLHSAFSRVTRS